MEDVKSKVKEYSLQVRARRRRQMEILKAYNAFVSVEQIAKEQGVSTARIYAILRAAGYTPLCKQRKQAMAQQEQKDGSNG